MNGMQKVEGSDFQQEHCEMFHMNFGFLNEIFNNKWICYFSKGTMGLQQI